MIIKIHKAGRSFKGVCAYLTHDAKAETSERVAWTHTLNVAHDDVASAVNDMIWTARSADLLKREAGAATGGSKLEKPVWHVSLSWAHSDMPDRAHMVETVQGYMRHMGWSDRQAVLVAHNDTRHAHVHVVVNSVSPVDGRAIRSSNDWRRTEAFALGYEREQGRVHCEERLKEPTERRETPTRESWQQFKPSEIAFERREIERLAKAPTYFERNDDKAMNAREWKALKDYQKEQREKFFIDGKQAFKAARNEAFREVRDEYRDQWNAFYAAKRNRHDRVALGGMKAAIMAAQKAALDEAQTRACDQLRKDRDQAYEGILAQQRFDKLELTTRQAQGLRTYQLMDVIYPAPEGQPRDGARSAMRSANSGERVEKETMFERATRSYTDPRRDAPKESTRPATALKPEATVPAPVQTPSRLRNARQADTRIERSDALVGKEHAEKSREMTDQAVQKDKAHVAGIMRASWNRSRSRGGRD
jgi:hypothetical protein